MTKREKLYTWAQFAAAALPVARTAVSFELSGTEGGVRQLAELSAHIADKMLALALKAETSFADDVVKGK